ncbi:hypothetical protein J4H92_01440 [Leucobacter weissii]|uniref:histidine kinase n=1 Tax=Leucobacter weissii TaxID=1983706 RepID=A0A939SAM1_9MICO|nr:hypothetical protein [Leucobacter weissii]MBO1900610.1 hypothetical protein [Leucobacter weissii]
MPQRVFHRISAALASSGSSRLDRLVRVVIGPRLVDPPIRVFALIYAFSGISPLRAETDEVWYLLFIYPLAVGVILLTPFAAGISGLLATGLFIVFIAVYPDYINPFLAPIMFAAAVLLAKLRWRLSLVLTGAAFLVVALEHRLEILVATPFSLLLYTWSTGSALALTGAYLEWRVNRETARKIEAAREHEREVQRIRFGLMNDTHDTVEHSLALQSGIIRAAAHEPDDQERTRMLGELALVNRDAQQQLRQLLLRLAEHDEEQPRSEVRFETEVARIANSLAAAAETGGTRVRVRVGDLPDAVPPEMMEDVRFVLRELITNMVKHAGDGPCELNVTRSAENGQATLSFETTNSGTADVGLTPRSLGYRAETRGGTCRMVAENGVVHVRLSFPIPD